LTDNIRRAHNAKVHEQIHVDVIRSEKNLYDNMMELHFFNIFLPWNVHKQEWRNLQWFLVRWKQ